jgi:outer membrane protein assembly factor BamB
MKRKFIIAMLAVLLSYPILAMNQASRKLLPDSVSTCETGVDCSHSPVAASKGTLYYDAASVIVGLNSETGKPLWTFSIPKGWVASNLVTVGSLIFFAGNTAGPCGPIYAMNTETRQVVWSRDYSSCAIWSDGLRLYLQGGSGDGIRAVDPATGRDLWRAEDDRPQFVQTLVVRNGRLYTNDRVLEAETGKTVEWWPNDYDVSTLAASDSDLFIGGQNGILSAADATTLKERWRSTILAGKEIVAVLACDQFAYAVGYVGDSTSARDGILMAFDTSDGQQKWSYQIHSSSRNLDLSPASIQGNQLFLLKPSDGKSGTEVVALDRTTGKRLWSFQSEDALQGPPFPEGRYIYIKNSVDTLLSLEESTGKRVWAYRP